MAGFFFAFSICLMSALGAIRPAHSISAMQSINVAVINLWFLTPFLGVAAALWPQSGAITAIDQRGVVHQARLWIAGKSLLQRCNRFGLRIQPVDATAC
ncbi:hypothetical protein [Paraburkholderia sp. RL17-347-BIC-D]|uniref:hypothetical protein n=1 Tax=Paraburkholderia sp. RL17-347-BIC-D TaxID=3031632 RepID=UPI0038BBCEAE